MESPALGVRTAAWREHEDLFGLYFFLKIEVVGGTRQSEEEAMG